MTTSSGIAPERLAAVIPAAGLARRMAREKVLLPFGNSTLLETILETLRAAGVGPVVVVLRPGQEDAAGRARASGALVIENPEPEEEMLVSIRLGIAALPPEVAAFFVWPVDHPAVRPETLRTLARHAVPGRAVIPCHRSRRGHPALVSRDLEPAIARLSPRDGLRRLWRDRPEAVLEVEVEDPGVLVDLDTPEAYREAAGKKLPE